MALRRVTPRSLKNRVCIRIPQLSCSDIGEEASQSSREVLNIVRDAALQAGKPTKRRSSSLLCLQKALR